MPCHAAHAPFRVIFWICLHISLLPIALNSSLHKDVASRATYSTLLEHRFLVHHQQINTDISVFVASVLDAAGGGSGDAGGNPGGTASGGKMDTADSANGL